MMMCVRNFADQKDLKEHMKLILIIIKRLNFFPLNSSRDAPYFLREYFLKCDGLDMYNLPVVTFDRCLSSSGV